MVRSAKKWQLLTMTINTLVRNESENVNLKIVIKLVANSI